MWWWFACSAPELRIRELPPPGGSEHSGLAAGSTPTGDSGGLVHTAVDGPCPPDMALASGVCIDRYEAYLEGWSPYEVPDVAEPAANALGEVPQGYVSAWVAGDACALAGKRLCTSDEWLAACRGDEDRVYPYGDAYDPGACNDTRAQHPVIELFGSDASFDPVEMNDPRLNQLPDSLAASGEFEDCTTPEGVHDLHGNLHEWVADAEGTFRGGFYVDAVINGPGCTYATTAHDPGYHDYSTGFRCCADPLP
jgi:sulfatase modifying factor 1